MLLTKKDLPRVLPTPRELVTAAGDGAHGTATEDAGSIGKGQVAMRMALRNLDFSQKTLLRSHADKEGEQRLVEKVREEWTGFKIDLPAAAPLVDDDGIAHSARGRAAPSLASGGGDSSSLVESSLGPVNMSVATAKFHAFHERLDLDRVRRNKIIPTLAQRRARTEGALAREHEHRELAAQRAHEHAEGVIARRAADNARWDRVREAREQVRGISVWLGFVTIAVRARCFQRALKTATSRNKAIRIIQRSSRAYVWKKWNSKFPESWMALTFHMRLFVRRRQYHIRRRLSYVIKTFLHEVKFSSTSMSQAIFRFRYRVVKCQRLAKSWILCTNTRKETLDRMMAEIETRLLESGVISDGFFRQSDDAECTSGRDQGASSTRTSDAAARVCTGERHLELFGSAIAPETRKKIMNMLINKAKRTFRSQCEKYADEKRKEMLGLRNVDTLSIKAMLHDDIHEAVRMKHQRKHELARPGNRGGLPLGLRAVSPGRIASPLTSPRLIGNHVTKDGSSHAKPHLGLPPFLTVYRTARKPMTKLVKRAYKAHRGKRMLRGADEDRELSMHVDEIVNAASGNPIPLIIERIEAVNGYQ